MADESGATRVAIIMDGNGRWATQRGLPVLEGHRRGAKTMKQTVKDAVALGIEELTVYAFSTENWSRLDEEVSGLMEMFGELIISETPELHEEGVRMRFVGSRQGVSPELIERMEWAEAETEGDDRMILFVAFNSGGRAEILDAAGRYEGGGEEEFRRLLYAPEMRDPELVIRTSGEERLSNFLLWQSAYSELFFTDLLWPDFDRSALEEALQEYASRRRRFGARG
jgi:undecaprenyl diphosphate synthase